eukprot:362147-Chlamydomonas_euryale.AAC.2
MQRSCPCKYGALTPRRQRRNARLTSLRDGRAPGTTPRTTRPCVCGHRSSSRRRTRTRAPRLSNKKEHKAPRLREPPSLSERPKRRGERGGDSGSTCTAAAAMRLFGGCMSSRADSPARQPSHRPQRPTAKSAPTAPSAATAVAEDADAAPDSLLVADAPILGNATKVAGAAQLPQRPPPPSCPRRGQHTVFGDAIGDSSAEGNTDPQSALASALGPFAAFVKPRRAFAAAKEDKPSSTAGAPGRAAPATAERRAEGGGQGGPAVRVPRFSPWRSTRQHVLPQAYCFTALVEEVRKRAAARRRRRLAAACLGRFQGGGGSRVGGKATA